MGARSGQVGVFPQRVGAACLTGGCTPRHGWVHDSTIIWSIRDLASHQLTETERGSLASPTSLMSRPTHHRLTNPEGVSRERILGITLGVVVTIMALD
ncbi:MAG: hypothetical protein SPG61_01220 [Arcanobacterium sp.]|nr:hypothetical protein [Arcanobacterium sp.]